MAIAKIKDEQQRNNLIDEAVTKNLSLVQIKEKIKALRTSHVGEATSPTVSSSTEDNSTPSPSTQVKTITSRQHCQKIVLDTSDMGWGFYDTLSEIYEDAFESII